MTYEQLLEKALAMDLESKEKNVLLPNARIIAFLLDNCEITVPEDTTFFLETNLILDHDRTIYDENMKTAQSRILRKIWNKRWERLPKYRTVKNDEAIKSRAYFGRQDPAHTAPDWQSIFELGLGGLKQRVLSRTGRPLNPDYVEAEVMVLEAAERFAHRAADAARAAGRTEMADGLDNLATNPPSNLFEAFQLLLFYYYLQQQVDAFDVRTLGRVDMLTMPFAAGQTPERIEWLCDRFIAEIQRINAVANMPFALGGPDENGKSSINPMSYALLKSYTKLAPPDVKLHILCGADIPEDYLVQCLESVKAGANSLVFINDKAMIDGLCRLGIDYEDARQYTIVGCYEATARGEVPCSASSRINMVKALEYTLHGGRDVLSGCQVGLAIEPNFETYEQLYEVCCKNLSQLADEAMQLTSISESYGPRVLAAPFYSALDRQCVINGGDAHSNTAAKYNNSSLICIGPATLADSLYAIRHLVYETKMLTLPQLIEILDNNWQGQEALRAYVRNKLPKFGTNDPRVDDIAVAVARHMADTVNGTPNGRGGVFRLGYHSIDWRIYWGMHTAATPDGRKNGETLSQNASATFGMDKEGPTAHILSHVKLPGDEMTNGCVLDLDLHSSAVSGENGTKVLLATLKTFLAQGGQTIHYNVLNVDTLKDAKAHPENYPNLQVRVCGWNADFTKMIPKEQDDFIRRAELQQG